MNATLGLDPFLLVPQCASELELIPAPIVPAPAAFYASMPEHRHSSRCPLPARQPQVGQNSSRDVQTRGHQWNDHVPSSCSSPGKRFLTGDGSVGPTLSRLQLAQLTARGHIAHLGNPPAYQHHWTLLARTLICRKYAQAHLQQHLNRLRKHTERGGRTRFLHIALTPKAWTPFFFFTRMTITFAKRHKPWKAGTHRYTGGHERQPGTISSIGIGHLAVLYLFSLLSMPSNASLVLTLSFGSVRPRISPQYT